ncbi:hypothetical protein RB195_009479 [Necator americanus]|uniref:Tissue inhibitor of metalloproteinase n=2 Tax=Necator americanus TaxID=51031 RepID=W2TPY4_NECAM|nr:tissue inhibitor of metalloproteinase [Necator americanus]ETN83828.1 tissue inhibitor of metalloproteinase [Necator americanus]
MKYFVIVAACVTVSNACSCLPFGTPKESFCSSDFVSHVKVISKKDPNTSPDGLQDITYVVQHICVYRKPSKIKKLSNQIVTASNSAACGIELDVGVEYLLGGSVDEKGVVRSFLCGIVEKWSDVPSKEKADLGKYKC